MAAPVHVNASPQGDHTRGELTHLTQVLQTTLELASLVDLFFQEVSQQLGISGLAYRNANLDVAYELGQSAPHSCNYNLALSESSLGELTFYRRRKFAAADTKQIEGILICLLYPLRNALMYHHALAQAKKDALTGANNRHALDEDLAKEVCLAQRHGADLAMVVLDIDHFKRINDNYGHQRGDYVIQAVTEAIQSCARSTDSLYRYGGEEFVVLLRNTDTQGAQLLAERIRTTVEAMMISCGGEQISVTVSAGITDLDHADTAESMFERGDRALYRAKDEGRNRTSCL